MRLRRFAAACLACSLIMLTGCPFGTDLETPPGENVVPGSGDKVNPGGGNVAPRTTVPAELQGTWQTTLAYIPAYYTGDIPVADFTGSLGVSYYFSPDGRYQYDLNSARAGGFCIRTTAWTEWGTLAIAGSEITLQPARATNSIMDSCGASDLDDNAPTKGSTLTVTPEQDQTGWPMLRVRFPNGEELLLEKCRDCK